MEAFEVKALMDGTGAPLASSVMEADDYLAQAITIIGQEVELVRLHDSIEKRRKKR